MSVTERAGISTALLILVVLQKNDPRPLSTYELGLWIQDNRQPPRPLSMIVKTLADDGYIVRSADAGKRAGLWCITKRGAESLQHRTAQRTAAEAWLAENPNYSDAEMAVLISLLTHGEQTPNRLTETCSLPLSPVRTALKRLCIRSLADRTALIFTGYLLTDAGRRVAVDLKVRREAA